MTGNAAQWREGAAFSGVRRKEGLLFCPAGKLLKVDILPANPALYQLLLLKSKLQK